MELYRCVYTYEAAEQDELTIHEGDLIEVTKKLEDGWWFGVTPKTSGNRTTAHGHASAASSATSVG